MTVAVPSGGTVLPSADLSLGKKTAKRATRDRRRSAVIRSLPLLVYIGLTAYAATSFAATRGTLWFAALLAAATGGLASIVLLGAKEGQSRRTAAALTVLAPILAGAAVMIAAMIQPTNPL